MQISNFEADVLETQAELGTMLMIFVISISKLTKTARSDEEVREAYFDSLLVSLFSIFSHGRTFDSRGGIMLCVCFRSFSLYNSGQLF